MPELDAEVFAVVGAAMEVHRELGRGLSEVIYAEALEVECGLRGIPVQREKRLRVMYKERYLQTEYRADLVCFDTLIVECKALTTPLGNVELGQILNYLRITRCDRGVLINFGTSSLQHRRVVRPSY